MMSMWMFPKIGVYTPKWMIYNGSKPYEQMDFFLGVKTHPYFLVQHPMFFSARGKYYSNHGGFVMEEYLMGFDASFFGFNDVQAAQFF